VSDDSLHQVIEDLFEVLFVSQQVFQIQIVHPCASIREEGRLVC
jgi:hypothetical protein